MTEHEAPPQDLFEKLQACVKVHGVTRARATLAQLRKRWGFKDLVGDRVEILAMDEVSEIWKRVSGRGEESIFEKLD